MYQENLFGNRGFLFSDFEDSNCQDKMYSRHILKSKDTLKFDSMVAVIGEDASVDISERR
jgi:hypothetical protein